MNSVVHSKVERAGVRGQLRDLSAWTRIDVLDEGCTCRRPVASPQFPTAHRRVGDEIKHASELREGVWRRRTFRIDLLDNGGSCGGSVTFPELHAVVPVWRREEQGFPDQDAVAHVSGIGAGRGVDVLDEVGGRRLH